MAKKCLVTTSLIGSVEWAKTAPTSIIKAEKGGDGIQTWAGKAVKDLRDTLARVPYEMNEAAQRGIAFEDNVYRAAKSGIIKETSSDFFKYVVGKVIGGEYQRKAKMDYLCEGEECFLYGKEDVYFPNEIIDLKTTQLYKKEKYVESFQHTLYCFIEKQWNFRYLVAEWDVYPKIKKIHEVPLIVDQTFAEKIVQSKIQQTFDFLKKNNLWELYRESYCLY